MTSPFKSRRMVLPRIDGGDKFRLFDMLLILPTQLESVPSPKEESVSLHIQERREALVKRAKNRLQ